MTLDDLPKAMIEKYLERYANATTMEKQKVESCLAALTCVLRETEKDDLVESENPSCRKIEKLCITSNTDFPSSFAPNGNSGQEVGTDPERISSDRLALTYFSGQEWSPNQRRGLLECKIENLLCQLPHENDDFAEDLPYNDRDPFYIDIKRDVNYSDDNEPNCVIGRYNPECRILKDTVSIYNVTIFLFILNLLLKYH